MHQIFVLTCLFAGIFTTGNSVQPPTNELIADGKSTYCWRIDGQKLDVVQPEYKDEDIFFGVQSQCPVSLQLKLPTRTIEMGKYLPVAWTANLEWDRLKKNPLNVTYFVQGKETSTGARLDLLSDVRTCDSEDPQCDPFSQAYQVTEIQKGVFNNNQTVSLLSKREITFRKEGKFTVMAHIVLPSLDGNTRFDYVVYDSITVKGGKPMGNTANICNDGSCSTDGSFDDIGDMDDFLEGSLDESASTASDASNTSLAIHYGGTFSFCTAIALTVLCAFI